MPADPNLQKERRLASDSDRLLETLGEVRKLEVEKRQEEISTPRFHELAEEITEKSNEVFRSAYREEADGDATETSDRSINDAETQLADRGRRDGGSAEGLR
jgi:hypothetical protein